MNLSTSGIIWAIDAIVALVCGIKIYQSYLRTRDKSVGHYAKFFIFFGLGFTGATIADPILTNIVSIKIAVIVSLFAMFVGVAYLARMATLLTYPKYENAAFWSIIAINVLTVVANVKYYLYSPYRSPFLDPETGVFVVNFPVVITVVMVLAAIFTMFVPGIIFIKKAIKAEDKAVKVRGTLLGTALLFFSVGFMACGAGRAILPMQISNLFIGIAYLPFLAATFYVVTRKLPQAIPPADVAFASDPKVRW